MESLYYICTQNNNKEAICPIDGWSYISLFGCSSPGMDKLPQVWLANCELAKPKLGEEFSPLSLQVI